MLKQSNYKLTENYVSIEPTSKDSQNTQKIPLIYVLHSGEIYSTESMAFTTIEEFLEEN